MHWCCLNCVQRGSLEENPLGNVAVYGWEYPILSYRYVVWLSSSTREPGLEVLIFYFPANGYLYWKRFQKRKEKSCFKNRKCFFVFFSPHTFHSPTQNFIFCTERLFLLGLLSGSISLSSICSRTSQFLVIPKSDLKRRETKCYPSCLRKKMELHSKLKSNDGTEMTRPSNVSSCLGDLSDQRTPWWIQSVSNRDVESCSLEGNSSSQILLISSWLSVTSPSLFGLMWGWLST